MADPAYPVRTDRASRLASAFPGAVPEPIRAVLVGTNVNSVRQRQHLTDR